VKMSIWNIVRLSRNVFSIPLLYRQVMRIFQLTVINPFLINHQCRRTASLRLGGGLYFHVNGMHFINSYNIFLGFHVSSICNILLLSIAQLQNIAIDIVLRVHIISTHENKRHRHWTTLQALPSLQYHLPWMWPIPQG
jgi:hypothetical protein